MRRLLLPALLLLAPLPAFAHGAHGEVHGFLAGLTHPIGGLDHVLAMVAVGLWAGLLGGRATWLLPLAFLTGMAGGGALGMAGVAMPMVEVGIVMSVVVLGALVAAAARLPVLAAMPLIALAGMLHGHAHGTELQSGLGAIGYSLGFLIATAGLHAAGVFAGLRAMDGAGRVAVRLAGAATAVLGLVIVGLV
jgi:urease accessory protein